MIQFGVTLKKKLELVYFPVGKYCVYGFMWLSGFMWLKVAKGGERWGKVGKSKEKL